MKEQSTQSMLPATLPTSIRPKPTKTEVIKALAKIKYENLRLAAKEATLHGEALADEIIHDIRAFLMLKPADLDYDLDSGYYYCDSDNGPTISNAGIQVSFRKGTMPPSIKDKLIAYHKYKNASKFHTKLEAVEAQIKKALSGELVTNARVEALIKSPETKAALEEIIAKLESE